MRVLKFRPFKKIDDKNLIEKAHNKMKELNTLWGKPDVIYWESAMELNDLILEIKRRNLIIDDKTFIDHILL